MGVITDQQITIIDSLEDLSIWAFDKCLNGELQYLIINHKEGEIPDEVTKKWHELYNKFCELTKNTSSLKLYLLACELNHLEAKFKFVPVLLKQLLKLESKELFQEYCKELSAWGFPIDQRKPLVDEIEKITNVLQNVRTKYNRKLSEYEELNNKKVDVLSIYDQKVKLERILKISIDVKKANVLEWLAYWKEVESIVKNNKK